MICNCSLRVRWQKWRFGSLILKSSSCRKGDFSVRHDFNISRGYTPTPRRPEPRRNQTIRIIDSRDFPGFKPYAPSPRSRSSKVPKSTDQSPPHNQSNHPTILAFHIVSQFYWRTLSCQFLLVVCFLLCLVNTSYSGQLYPGQDFRGGPLSSFPGTGLFSPG